MFLAIQSCQADIASGRHYGPVRTYLHDWGHMHHYALIVGKANPAHRPNYFGYDVEVSVPDGYDYCSFKTQAAVQLAYAMGHEWMFHCCNDTYVALPRLRPQDGVDYIGHRCAEGHASGGCGYWLSRTAMKALIEATPWVGMYEDVWVGETLRAAGIGLTHDPRYSDGQPTWDDDKITAHLSRGTGVYDVCWMHEAHAGYLKHEKG